jgi:hypothetical protein
MHAARSWVKKQPFDRTDWKFAILDRPKESERFIARDDFPSGACDVRGKCCRIHHFDDEAARRALTFPNARCARANNLVQTRKDAARPLPQEPFETKCRAPKESNWLPAPAGSFNVTMRLYAPRSPVIDGARAPPVVKRT